MLNEHQFADRTALTETLFAWCMQALAEDLDSAAEVSCLLSGGNSPLALYEALAGAGLPWQRIRPALVDERWVDVDNPGSNEGMLRRVFAGQQAFQQRLLGMYRPGMTNVEAQMLCCDDYRALPEPVSFCLLGMGPDAHTASLFPRAGGLALALETDAPCQAISALASPVTGALTERMSLTLSGILRARRLILLITGEDKWQVYQQARQQDDTALMPVSALLRQDSRDIDIFYAP